MLFLSFWSGSTRFCTGRTGYSLGIRYLKTIKTTDTQGLYTASDKNKKLILSEEISKEYKICSVCYIYEIRAIDYVKREGGVDITLVFLQHRCKELVLYCIHQSAEIKQLNGNLNVTQKAQEQEGYLENFEYQGKNS